MIHSDPPRKRARISVRELVVLSLMAAIMFASQVAMAALPNIEPVTVILMACALVFGWKTLYPLYVFVLLEALLYGFTIWVVNYLYVWLVLVTATILLRRVASRVFWAVIGGAFGLLFGALCAIPYFFIGGWTMGFSYWVAGIPFDLIHCVSNAVLVFALLPLLTKLLNKLTLDRR